MSSTAHHFMIMLKPLRQQATSASCHFNVWSIFFSCVFAPHFSEASSPLPTAIGYEAAAKHVTYNEPGKLHTKPSDHWLPEENSLLARRRGGQVRQWGGTCMGAAFQQPGALSWWFSAGQGWGPPLCASLPQLCGMPLPVYHFKPSWTAPL